MKANKILAAVAVVGAGAFGAMPAQALTWAFSNEATPPCYSASTCDTWDSTRKYESTTDSTKRVDVYAWENSTNGSTGSPSALGLLKPAWVDAWSGNGLGASDKVDTGTPNHAIDNKNNYEMVLLDFGEGNLVTLTQVSVGYVSGDSDISLLAYTGLTADVVKGGAFTNDLELEARTYANLNNANGWTVVGNYAGNGNTGARNVNTGSTTVESRYWMIGAYNGAFSGTPCTPAGTTCNAGNDYFKVASATGSWREVKLPPTGTPTPGAAALLGLGLGIIGWQRRRRSAA